MGGLKGYERRVVQSKKKIGHGYRAIHENAASTRDKRFIKKLTAKTTWFRGKGKVSDEDISAEGLGEKRTENEPERQNGERKRNGEMERKEKIGTVHKRKWRQEKKGRNETREIGQNKKDIEMTSVLFGPNQTRRIGLETPGE